VRACEEGLKHLEGLHKVLVLCLWLSFHNAIAFYDADEAYALTACVERALVMSPAGVFAWTREESLGGCCRCSESEGGTPWEGKIGWRGWRLRR
jgi:hypothetical protein